MLININEENFMILSAVKEDYRKAKVAFEIASEMIYSEERRLWDRIKELYPKIEEYKDRQLLWKERIIIAMKNKEEV